MNHSFSKCKLILIALITVFSFSLEAQNVTDEVAKIKNWFTEIVNNPTKYPQKEFSNFLYIDGSNVTVSCSKDNVSNQIVLISTNGNSDWVEHTTDYYFKNGILFFVFETGYTIKEWATHKDLGITEEELDVIGGAPKLLEHYEHRIYFSNQTCIRYLEKKEVRKATDYENDMSDVSNQTLDASLIDFSTYKTDAQVFLDFIKAEEAKQ
ncbi:MAG: hypothetical protein IPO21_03960 [Bacteroidales bacterium]|nr:hypothetical protein [Bacteroidales bacterium]